MLIKIAQLVLSLTILVTLHEFGHYWFAKKFKCRVDKFYLFFDFLFPFAGVLNISLFKKKIGVGFHLEAMFKLLEWWMSKWIKPC